MKISAKVVIYSVLLMLTSSSRHFARAFRNSRSRIDKIGLCLSEMRQLASTNIDDDVEIHTADALPSSFNSKFLQTLLEREALFISALISRLWTKNSIPE